MKASTAQKLELYNQGMTDEGIAEQLGLSRTTVTSWRKYHGLGVRGAPSGCPMEEALNPSQCEVMGAFLGSLENVKRKMRSGTKVDVLAYAKAWGQKYFEIKEDERCYEQQAL